MASASTKTLTYINTWLVQSSLWPSVLYTVCLMLTGVVGNTLVLVVYRRRFRRSVTRMFIFTLAVLDLTNCLVTMPSELVVLLEFASFPSEGWCKVSRWLTYILNGTSSCILISIALDRYYKVCQPTLSFITVYRARNICIGTLVFSTVMSVPALMLYGDVYFLFEIIGDEVHPIGLTSELKPKLKYNSTVVGTTCLVNSHYIDTDWPMAFYSIMCLMYVVMVAVVVFAYTNVARTMFYLRARHDRLFSFYSAYRDSNPNILDQPGPEEGEGDSHGRDVDEGYNGSGAEHSGQVQDSSTGHTAREEQIQQELSRVHGHGQEGEGSGHVILVSGQPLSASRDRFIQDGSARDLSVIHQDVLLKSNDALQGSIDTFSGSRNIISNKDEVKPKANITKDDASILINEHPKAPPRNKKNSKQFTKPATSLSRVPTIRVDNFRDENSTDSDTDSNDDEFGLSMKEPMFSNSLLLRRIRSMENVRSTSPKLQRLNIPASREQNNQSSLKMRFSLKYAGKRRKSKSFHDVANLKAKGRTLGMLAGHMAPASLEPDTIGRDLPEKTMTLTRKSPKGSKKLYVLPLTGLSSKAAAQSVAAEEQKQNQQPNGRTSSLRGKGSKKWGSRKAKHRPVVAEDQDRVKFNKDIDKVKLRSKSPTSPQAGGQQRSLKGQITMKQETVAALHSRNPRGARSTLRQNTVSTADILKERHRRKSLHPFRTSWMLLVISLVFVLSFCPFFVIVLYRSSLGTDFLRESSTTTLGVISVFIRSSLLSNAVNPVVYSLMSSHFRKECKHLWQALIGG